MNKGHYMSVMTMASIFMVSLFVVAVVVAVLGK